VKMFQLYAHGKSARNHQGNDGRKSHAQGSRDEIDDDLPLFGPDGLGLDSIDALELVVSLEKKFGVTVPNSQVARQALATVNSIHDYVGANRKP
jgi:acyl carrier protein